LPYISLEEAWYNLTLGSTCRMASRTRVTPLRIELPRQHRLVPRRRHEGHGREVVKFLRAAIIDNPRDRQLVEQIAGTNGDSIQQMLETPQIRCARTSDYPDDLVTLLEQQLGKVRAVLTGNAGNDRALRHGGRTILMSRRGIGQGENRGNC
jgi:hypothetical protein